jgi:hypothetical protein
MTVKSDWVLSEYDEQDGIDILLLRSTDRPIRYLFLIEDPTYPGKCFEGVCRTLREARQEARREVKNIMSLMSQDVAADPVDATHPEEDQTKVSEGGTR